MTRKYEIELPFTYNTFVNSVISEWIDEIPEVYRNRPGLHEFFLGLAQKIYENGLAKKGDHLFYKLINLLDSGKLEYYMFKTLKDYYHFDLKKWLLRGNCAEYFIHYPCNNSADLKKALNTRNNRTNDDTLAEILSHIV